MKNSETTGTLAKTATSGRAASTARADLYVY